jgi:hypothetical protein
LLYQNEVSKSLLNNKYAGMVGQELKPKDQPCLLTDHEVAGQTFHLVNRRQYLMIINLFREGGNMPNPIKRVNRLTVNTASGVQLIPDPTPARSKKPLPNCVTVSALFNAASCQAPSIQLLPNGRISEWSTWRLASS